MTQKCLKNRACCPSDAAPSRGLWPLSSHHRSLRMPRVQGCSPSSEAVAASVESPLRKQVTKRGLTAFTAGFDLNPACSSATTDVDCTDADGFKTSGFIRPDTAATFLRGYVRQYRRESRWFIARSKSLSESAPGCTNSIAGFKCTAM